MGEVWLLQVVAVVAVHPAGPRNTHAVAVHSAGPRNTHPTAGAHAIVMVKNSLTAVPVSQFVCFKPETA
jgi:hypothetical protein